MASETGGGDFELREQDKWLPIANVYRIMKNALPKNAKVSREAKECVQECVSEFVSFITSEASEKCLTEKRKTVNGEDILFAMNGLGFENYAEVLKIYLAKYREHMSRRDKAREFNAKRSRCQENEESPDGSNGTDAGSVNAEGLKLEEPPIRLGDDATSDPDALLAPSEDQFYGSFEQTADEPLYGEYQNQFPYN